MSSRLAQAQCAPPQQATPQLKTQFEINDLADTDRILLTSKSIQNDIEEFSGDLFLKLFVYRNLTTTPQAYLRLLDIYYSTVIMKVISHYTDNYIL